MLRVFKNMSQPFSCGKGTWTIKDARSPAINHRSDACYAEFAPSLRIFKTERIGLFRESFHHKPCNYAKVWHNLRNIQDGRKE